MHKQFTYALFGCSMLFIVLTSAIPSIVSNSAPASSTGAPGEVNCMTSGCHKDFTANSGPGKAGISINNGVTKYVPGTTSTITVSCDHPSLVRFGFQLVALRDKDNTNAGTLKVKDASRTQTLAGNGSMMSRKYMTYTYLGTSAVTTGKGEWSFEWEAPETDEGPVTFYLAAIAANNDGTDAGDNCYTSSLTLQPASGQEMSAYVDNASGELYLSYALNTDANIVIELYTINGQKTGLLYSGSKAKGSYNESYAVKGRYARGIYFISMKNGAEKSMKKIYLD